MCVSEIKTGYLLALGNEADWIKSSQSYFIFRNNLFSSQVGDKRTGYCSRNGGVGHAVLENG